LKLVTDACSLIILDKGGVLETALKLREHMFFVGSFVKDESGPLILPHLQVGSLTELPDDRLSLSRFTELLERYGLGYGETECIAFAISENMSVCSDDAKARKAAQAELGLDRVVGSIFLLRECVKAGSLSTRQAFLAYELMKSRGAFLPDLQEDQFER
jgi:predicted nucleic acid-binding protein